MQSINNKIHRVVLFIRVVISISAPIQPYRPHILKIYALFTFNFLSKNETIMITLLSALGKYEQRVCEGATENSSRLSLIKALKREHSRLSWNQREGRGGGARCRLKIAP